MRAEIPANNVCHHYENVLSEFIMHLKSKQAANVLSVYLAGSYARGDATDFSDLDVFCVFKTINPQVLYDVGFSARHTAVSYDLLEINPQCMSIDEFNNELFENWSEIPIRTLDSVLLYGNDLCSETADKKAVEEIYKKYLAEIIMSIRHYISVDEPLEKLTHQKIKTYILKPLMYALRLERYCETGTFPLSNNDLLCSYNNQYRLLIEYFTNKDQYEKDISKNKKEVFKNIYELVSKLI